MSLFLRVSDLVSAGYKLFPYITINHCTLCQMFTPVRKMVILSKQNDIDHVRIALVTTSIHLGHKALLN